MFGAPACSKNCLVMSTWRFLCFGASEAHAKCFPPALAKKGEAPSLLEPALGSTKKLLSSTQP